MMTKEKREKLDRVMRKMARTHVTFNGFVTRKRLRSDAKKAITIIEELTLATAGQVLWVEEEAEKAVNRVVKNHLFSAKVNGFAKRGHYAMSGA